ncbi:MAG: hypothetical protein Q8P40_11710, partial [Nitrospirota bacterium]|nr:hypothetical protein [Nitrospirota bacterium]
KVVLASSAAVYGDSPILKKKTGCHFVLCSCDAYFHKIIESIFEEYLRHLDRHIFSGLRR